MELNLGGLTKTLDGLAALRQANKLMTPVQKVERLRNALSRLTSEERQAMAYGLEHPKELGVDKICVGKFFDPLPEGGYTACPETLMMLKMGTCRVLPQFFTEIFADSKDARNEIYDEVWRAIDWLTPTGDNDEEEEMRAKETIVEIHRILDELEGK